MRRHVFDAAASAAARADQDWGSLQWLASGEIGNAEAVTLGRTRIKPGHANPRHCHPNCEEILYLLAGRLKHTVGTETVLLEAGDTLSIAAGCFHNATNIGVEEADMIVTYSTGTREFQLEQP